MSNFTTENLGENTFLVYEAGEGETVDTMGLGMITNNEIPGLATVITSQIDTVRVFKYDITSKNPISDIFARPVNKKRLIGIFKAVCDALTSADEYMIDSNMILLNPEYIYADITTNETVLICLPIEGRDNGNPEPAAFFKNILYGTQLDSSESTDYFGKLINFFNGSTAFTLEKFKELLNTLEDRRPQPKPAVGKAADYAARPTNIQMPGSMQQEQHQARPEAPAPAQQPLRNPVQQKAPAMPKQVERAGFAIPGGGSAPARPVKPGKREEASEGDNDEKISWFYLMQHYNKENARKYKEQKAAREAEKEAAKSGKKNKSENIPEAGRNDIKNPAGVRAERPLNIPANNANSRADGFGNTICYEEAENNNATVSCDDYVSEKKASAYLIRSKNNERIVLSRASFNIGRDADFNDYVISDNKFVGHSHATIVVSNGEYFITDKNSKNHTYVNNEMVTGGASFPIKQGDRIRLANEEFVFHIY